MCEVRNTVPPRADERVQQLLDLPRGDRVDPFERLVEKEQPRRRQQRRGERQLLPHAVREVGDERRRRAGEVHQREQVGRARLERLVGHAVHLADEAERFGGGQPIEEREILGHDADAPLDLDRIGQRVDAEDAHLAGGRAEQARSGT